jgi:hypothetical protein
MCIKDSRGGLFPVHRTDGQQMTNMPRQRQAYIFANLKNIAWVRSDVHEDIFWILFVSCHCNWIQELVLCLQLCEFIDITERVSSGSHFFTHTHTHTHKRGISCQYCWNICIGTILRVICWIVVADEIYYYHCEPTVNPSRNQQAWSRDPHLHPNWRNSSLKHPLVKWCWLFSLT